MLRGEAYSAKVVHASFQVLLWSLEVLDGGVDAVVDVDHRQGLLWAQPALVVVALECVEEDLCSINNRINTRKNTQKWKSIKNEQHIFNHSIDIIAYMRSP